MSSNISQFFMFLCCFFPLTMCILGFPLYELCLGVLYKKEIEESNCSTLQFNLSTWLIVKSIATLLDIVIIGFCIACKNKIIGVFLINVFRLFIFTWLIVGSIIFFRDCINIEPLIVNISLWVIIILGFLSIITTKNNLFDDENDKKDNTIFDIC